MVIYVMYKTYEYKGLSIEYHYENDLDNVFCGFDELMDNEEICFIDFVFISKDLRGKGIAKEGLINFIESQKNFKIKKFYLFAQVDPDDYDLEETQIEELFSKIRQLTNFYSSVGFCQGVKVIEWTNQIDMYLELK